MITANWPSIFNAAIAQRGAAAASPAVVRNVRRGMMWRKKRIRLVIANGNKNWEIIRKSDSAESQDKSKKDATEMYEYPFCTALRKIATSVSPMRMCPEW